MLNFEVLPIPCDTETEKKLCLETWKFFRSQSEEVISKDLPTERTTLLKDLYKIAIMIEGRNAALDSDIDFITAYLADNGFKIPCATGCSACCKQAIVANPFEAALIGIHISNDVKLREYFSIKYAQWEIETRNTREDFMAWAQRFYSDGIDDGRFKCTDFRTPCPFLEDDLCKIYTVRPYCCRSYLSTSESCRNETDKSLQPGFQGVDVGTYTDFAANNKLLMQKIWRFFGIDSRSTRVKLLPDLVNKFLNENIEGYLAYCEYNENNEPMTMQHCGQQNTNTNDVLL